MQTKSENSLNKLEYIYLMNGMSSTQNTLKIAFKKHLKATFIRGNMVFCKKYFTHLLN